ncbi:MAG TPA: hypothetical protein VF785_25435 [Gemmatimonadaceae bacterium]
MTTAQKPQPISAPPARTPTQSSADKVLSQVGWGVFLLLTGIAWILPSERHPGAFWLIGVGALLLLLSAIRNRLHMSVDGFGVFVGVVALIAGIASALNTNLPLFPLVLVALGLVLIAKVFLTLRSRRS